jgi:hypothetical protein
MQVFKLEQFRVEIEPTSIEVDLNSIKDKAIDKTLSVDIVLICDGGKFGVTAENMSYNYTWSDDDIEPMVNEWLKQFSI